MVVAIPSRSMSHWEKLSLMNTPFSKNGGNCLGSNSGVMSNMLSFGFSFSFISVKFPKISGKDRLYYIVFYRLLWFYPNSAHLNCINLQISPLHSDYLFYRLLW